MILQLYNFETKMITFFKETYKIHKWFLTWSTWLNHVQVGEHQYQLGKRIILHKYCNAMWANLDD